jgi:hypothetical protein
VYAVERFHFFENNEQNGLMTITRPIEVPNKIHKAYHIPVALENCEKKTDPTQFDVEVAVFQSLTRTYIYQWYDGVQYSTINNDSTVGAVDYR